MRPGTYRVVPARPAEGHLRRLLEYSIGLQADRLLAPGLQRCCKGLLGSVLGFLVGFTSEDARRFIVTVQFLPGHEAKLEIGDVELGNWVGDVEGGNHSTTWSDFAGNHDGGLKKAVIPKVY